ncbi:hypothetical protein KTO58_12135 [Chitinophaga pendula]|uniref:hypothetical protein n=1 Tax=Chitinophaga TaxID=79328 RepID=UPI000BAEA4B6|nr:MULTISPECIES: hypothetical protein [Chitinophaga]ASZ12490.1 hypothetical protein CK934_16765 [Chitinophaga sp. MD30]UCJ09909.1 hypothetical protein KTO58_12135 [Chitinophaga pendula]
MKPILLGFILSFFLYYANAQSFAPGYYITPTRDTVTAQIKIKKGAFGQSTNDFIDEVEIIDSIKGAVKYLPEDINGYGFTYKGRRYIFASKPIKNGKRKFLSVLYIGSKSSLYLHGLVTTGGAYASKQVFYTFEKPGNTYLFLKNILNNNFRSQVKEFYKDSPGVMQIIDTKLRYWLELDQDLIEILRKANL